MNETVRIQPDPTALAILRRLREAGHEAYFCGGCVRDTLLGCPPKDWDITTSATPDEVEGLFEKTVPVGKAFGVILVVKNGTEYEVATFRADSPTGDGRRPETVQFTSAEEDVQRRDFTINALLYDPEDDRILDYVGGQEDLKQGILRTVGEPRRRFLEDHLRLLRAVRFAGRTGFRIENSTRACMAELAGLVRILSGERVGQELLRMLSEGYARYAVTLLEETHLLAHILPEAAAMRGTPQPLRFHPEGDVMDHTLIMLGMLDACVRGQHEESFADALPDVTMTEAEKGRGMTRDPRTREEHIDDIRACWRAIDPFGREVLAWATLLHDVGKPPTIHFQERIRFHEHDKDGAALCETILERLKRPRKVIDAVRDLVGRHIHMANLRQMRKAKLRRWLQDPLFPLHLELHRMDCGSSHRMLANHAFGVAAWREECARAPEPEPLLTGKDLIKMGYAPGPTMGTILQAVEEARLEGDLDSSETAAAFVRERFPIDEAP